LWQLDQFLQVILCVFFPANPAAKGCEEQSSFGIARMGFEEVRQQAFGLAQVSFQVFSLGLHEQAIGVIIWRRLPGGFLGHKPGCRPGRDNPEP